MKTSNQIIEEVKNNREKFLSKMRKLQPLMELIEDYSFDAVLNLLKIEGYFIDTFGSVSIEVYERMTDEDYEHKPDSKNYKQWYEMMTNVVKKIESYVIECRKNRYVCDEILNNPDYVQFIIGCAACYGQLQNESSHDIDWLLFSNENEFGDEMEEDDDDTGFLSEIQCIVETGVESSGFWNYPNREEKLEELREIRKTYIN